jgi:hypothetical protein
VTLSLTASCSASTKCSRIAPKKKDHKNKARKSLTSKFQYLIRPRKSLAETDCSRKGAWKHTTQAETSKRSRLRKEFMDFAKFALEVLVRLHEAHIYLSANKS